MYAQGTGHTDIGSHRNQNEDTLLVDNDYELYIVCDGMGGHACGERAAAIALKATARSVAAQQESVTRARSGKKPNIELTEVAQTAIQEACRSVYEDATSPDGCPGMGTTLTMLLVAGKKAVMGHVGHSRLYLKRHGKVTQLSSDHTMAAELEQRGAFTPEQTRRGPFAHTLTRSLGLQPTVQVDTLVLDVLPGDLFLLCTDGLTDYLETSSKLAAFLVEPIDSIPERLVAFANQAGGEDNITVLAVNIEVDDPEEAKHHQENVETRIEALGSTPMFTHMPMARIQRLLNICSIATYKPGDEIQAEGTICDRMCILLDGALELSSGGKVLGEIGPNTAFGEDCLLRSRPARATVKAIKPATLLVIPHDRFWALAQRRPWFGMVLFERLGKWVGAALERSWEFSDVKGYQEKKGLRAVELF